MSLEKQTRPADDAPFVEVMLLHVAEMQSASPWLENLLDPTERERAAGFALAGAREESVISRGVLRLLLGRRTGIPARDLVFRYGAGGKPELAQPTAKPLAFNVSHSHGLIAIALGHVHAVGVDVERIDLEAPVMDLARTAWGPEAAASMVGFASDGERSRAFFRQWVRFEAAGKYYGSGVLATPQSADEWQQEEVLTHHAFTKSVNGQSYCGCVVTQEFARVQAETWLSQSSVVALRAG